jgi:mRNA interferase YafQ
MYIIRRLKDFETSLRRISSSGVKSSTINKIEKTIDILASGKPLPTNCRDHKLTGELSGFRECHIQPDLLLIYKIEKNELVLILANIGSHSYLFK